MARGGGPGPVCVGDRPREQLPGALEKAWVLPSSLGGYTCLSLNFVLVEDVLFSGHPLSHPALY